MISSGIQPNSRFCLTVEFQDSSFFCSIGFVFLISIAGGGVGAICQFPYFPSSLMMTSCFSCSFFASISI